ncbi:hypothetical protein C8Q74DRAFT_1251512 [Fomes fomentarius]|nr:hypothetical protein C8Q74DRAFT_1251512 [Fomes fomentarius]
MFEDAHHGCRLGRLAVVWTRRVRSHAERERDKKSPFLSIPTSWISQFLSLSLSVTPAPRSFDLVLAACLCGG